MYLKDSYLFLSAKARTILKSNKKKEEWRLDFLWASS